ncbi:MAG: D-tyrosyl-tRNA(Tyr) deacylase [Chloroflexi bacterium]|nr:D-tyrosyl-tRNA(Tyr) deacylase [Chloroflexota bacterium]
MRVLLQRVAKASVTVSGQTVGHIGPGLALLVGAASDDTDEDARYLADKIANLRIFDDQTGKFNLSALDVGAELLVISQFTLYADARKGRRPSFTAAAPPDIAAPLIDRFADMLRATGLRVATGQFGTHMLVELHNDGPVTLFIDSKDLMSRPRRG